jgi:hypothetical protein
MMAHDPDEPLWRAWRRRVFGAFLASTLVIGLFLSFRPTGFDGEEVAQEEESEAPEPANGGGNRNNNAEEESEPAEEETEGPSRAERQELIQAGRSPEETTVQVLDAGGGSSATAEAEAALADLGYDVLAVNTSRVDYPTTTVLYTDGNDAEAEALRARDDRFAEVAPNERLSEAVDIHIAVGADWSD